MLDFYSSLNEENFPHLLRRFSSSLGLTTWITHFLTDRRQYVRLGKTVSDSVSISTGSPQGSAYGREVARLVSWCGHNNLQRNAQKTVEMIVDFRKVTAPLPPLALMDSPITIADSFRFLGTTITRDLKWEPNISSLIKKAQQRMFFLRKLRKLKLPPRMLAQFYTAIIESILTPSILPSSILPSSILTSSILPSSILTSSILTPSILTSPPHLLHHRVVIGCRLPSIQDLCISRTRRCAGRITADPSHPGHGLFSPLPSGRRLRSIRTKTSRYTNSFFPSAIRLLNTK
ncbi:hypothetical protein D4764_05G0012940 [Takifugu flavidus]|uniref:Alkylated DNA repair protein AlkB homologue 8 N-terminal domain-containing protein n=1 Tax=Takifugu flavidus TaxID=433684 RepID=A0A5C6N0W4_9TELE|nr:hypothetical protein D4764_05G0012940 [Takifugu flavidus]